MPVQNGREKPGGAVARSASAARVSTFSVTAARAALPEILDRVLGGDEVTITRHGEPVAVVVRPDTLRVRRADEALAAARRIRDLLDEGARRPLSTAPAVTAERAEDLVAYVRAGRLPR